MASYDPFKYPILPPEPPRKKPPLVALCTRNVPDVVAVAAYQAMFTALVGYMKKVQLPYVDGNEFEPHDFHCTVKSSGGGKSYVMRMVKNLLKPRVEVSDKVLKKLAKISKKNRAKGDGKDKQERPDGAGSFIPVPPEDVTGPAVTQLLCDAEEAGDESINFLVPEIDGLNQIVGSHTKGSKFLRKCYDRDPVGALRATDNGVTGNPPGRVNITTGGTVNCVRRYFGGKNAIDIENGSLGRFCVTYLSDNVGGMNVVQGRYDQQWYDQVAAYVERLQEARGLLDLPDYLLEVTERLKKDVESIADLSENNVFRGWGRRSVEMAFIKACVLYVAQKEFGKVEAEWIEWSMWHDLYSKIVLFMPQTKTINNEIDYQEVRQYGPRNMLDELDETFTVADLIKVRAARGKDDLQASLNKNLSTWKDRKYITPVKGTKDTYQKTRAYLSKHPQAKKGN